MLIDVCSRGLHIQKKKSVRVSIPSKIVHIKKMCKLLVEVMTISMTAHGSKETDTYQIITVRVFTYRYC